MHKTPVLGLLSYGSELHSCTSICKYKLTTAASVLQSVPNYNCSTFFHLLIYHIQRNYLTEYFPLQFSLADHFNFINSLSKRFTSDMRRPRKRSEAKGLVHFTAHGSIMFWKSSHSILNSFSINFRLTTAKL